MIDPILDRIEAHLRESSTLDSAQREALLRLVDELRKELAILAQDNPEHARSVAGLAETSAYESTRQEPSPRVHRLSLDALEAAVDGLEQEYPSLVRCINEICLLLSNMGI